MRMNLKIWHCKKKKNGEKYKKKGLFAVLYILGVMHIIIDKVFTISKKKVKD
jgi:hypothetical protein